ncbi:MAG: hypothetical protein AAGI23_11765 [Bacteroidota bacterium]
MKSRLFFAITFSLLFTNIAIAQVVTVSEDMALRSDMRYQLIGELQDQYLLFQDEDHEFFVQAYDSDLRMTWDKEIKLDKRRPEILDIIATPDQEHFYVVYQHRYKGDLILKAHQYDAGANLVDSTIIYNLGTTFTTQFYQTVTSQDRSKVLTFTEHNNGEIEAYAFDLEKMEFLWETSFQPDNLILSRDPHQIVMTNEGEMYYIILKHNYRSRSKDHIYDVYHQSNLSTSIGHFEINLADRLTYDVYFEYDDLNGQLIAGGLYSDKNLAWARGYFLLRVSNDRTANHRIDFYDFDESLIQDFLERDAPSKIKGIFDAQLQDIILRQDGGILMVLEKIRTTERGYGGLPTRPVYSPTINSITSSTDFNFEHLMVISIHPDGEQHWENVLRKRQQSQDDGAAFSSYFIVKSPRELHFIFNDEIREENTVSEYVITGSGKAERNSVMNTENQKLRLRFMEAVQTSASELIIPSERRNRLKLVRIKL